MKKHYKSDCSNCLEYPYECDDCCSEVKAVINQKTHYRKKKESYRSRYVINNN